MKIAPIGLALLLYFGAAGQTSSPASSQTFSINGEEHAGLLAGRHHNLIAYAGKDHSFTLEIGAYPAKRSDIPGFITIDNQIVQSTLVPADRPGGFNALTEEKEKEVLLKYMNYELGYYRKKLKQHYSHLQSEWMSLNGRLFLLWYFDMPENYKLVSRQVYASTLFYDQVMDLNAPVFKADDWGRARTILVNLAGTMKTYDHRLDLDALRKKL
jgi:hypothetical protein